MAQAMVIFTVLQAAVGAWESWQAAQDQQEIRAELGELNILNRRAQLAENAEKERRLRNAQAQQEGTAKAMAAATGVDSTSGSILASLDAMEAENITQLNWLKSSGISKITALDQQHLIDMQRSKAAEKGSYFDFASNIVAGAGATFGAGQDAGWWGGADRPTVSDWGVAYPNN